MKAGSIRMAIRRGLLKYRTWPSGLVYVEGQEKVPPSPGGQDPARLSGVLLEAPALLPGQKTLFLKKGAGTEDRAELELSHDPGLCQLTPAALTRRLSRWRSQPLARGG